MRIYLKLLCILLALLLCCFAFYACTDSVDNEEGSDDGEQDLPEDEDDGAHDFDELPENPFENGYNPDGWV